MNEDHSNFMIAQLQSVGRPVKYGNRKNILTTCASPTHLDSHPSMSIRRDGQTANCFSCPWTGTWNRIAHELNLDPLPGSNGQPKDEIAALGDSLAALKMKAEDKPREVKLPKNIVPWTRGPWRGFSEDLFKRLGTYHWRDFRFHDKTTVERILWPFTMNGKLLGGTGRILPISEPSQHPEESLEEFKARKKMFWRSHPKYRNLPASQATKVLFGYDLFPSLRTVVLAEGPTSTLKLLDAGLPAMGICGSENWSKFKATMLRAKGVRNVVVCMDGDKAGRHAATSIVKDMGDFCNVTGIDLPEGTDPDDCSPEWFAYIVGTVKPLLLKAS